jgi:aryl-alcohol dehydrogenase-like predicted oxidoreductase
MTLSVNRRDFIRTTAAAAGGLALSGDFLARAEDVATVRKTRSHNDDMDYRRLGRTGLWVSAVCLGGHWKRVADAIGIKIPSVSLPAPGPGLDALKKNRYDVVTRCLEVGINYVDACTMGEIAVYGPALKGRRDKMYMGFAMWPDCPRKKEYRTAAALLKKLDEGLKAAETDYVDVWRLVASSPGEHSPADEEEFIEAFEKAKEQGKARFTGVSSHGRPWLKRLAETYPEHFQVLLFPYTAKTKELPEDSMFDAIRKHDIGTFGIKPFASGSLFNNVADGEERDKRARMTIRYILNNPAITAPIPGLATTEEVDNMALAVKEGRDLDTEEVGQLERMNDEMWANLPTNYQWLREWEYV